MKEIKSYEDIRKGDIGFYVGKGGISDIIEKVTTEKKLLNLGYKIPSHTFIFLGEGKVIEAVEKTRINSDYIYKKEFSQGNVYIFRPVDDSLQEECSGCLDAFTRNFNNYPYGWLQIVGFLPVLLFREIGVNIPNPFPLFTVCSEDTLIYLRIIYTYLKEKGNETGNTFYLSECKKLEWVKNLNRNTTDPALLLLYCITDGKIKK